MAGSYKGYAHNIESIEKMRNAATGRTHTDLVKSSRSDNRKGENNSFYGLNHKLDSLYLIRSAATKRVKLPVTSIKVEITDLETKTTVLHDSIRKAAHAINSDIKTILRREKLQMEKGINTFYRNKYIITFKRNAFK